jgi:hypothetical protein
MASLQMSAPGARPRPRRGPEVKHGRYPAAPPLPRGSPLKPDPLLVKRGWHMNPWHLLWQANALLPGLLIASAGGAALEGIAP